VRCDLQLRDVPSGLQDFVDRHAADRSQLSLPLRLVLPSTAPSAGISDGCAKTTQIGHGRAVRRVIAAALACRVWPATRAMKITLRAKGFRMEFDKNGWRH
jgi:hypothetical protein